MKPDWQVLDELAVLLGLDSDEDDTVAAVFDRLGFPYSAEHYAHALARKLVLELERRHEAGAVVREYHEDDGLGLLYYEPDAADGDEDTRARASERLAHKVAGNISASFVGPWCSR